MFFHIWLYWRKVSSGACSEGEVCVCVCVRERERELLVFVFKLDWE